jgi:hypothetical protein
MLKNAAFGLDKSVYAINELELDLVLYKLGVVPKVKTLR